MTWVSETIKKSDGKAYVEAVRISLLSTSDGSPFHQTLKKRMKEWGVEGLFWKHVGDYRGEDSHMGYRGSLDIPPWGRMERIEVWNGGGT